MDKMNLNNTQFTNFQKLRYFHLALPLGGHNEWILTRDGTEFLQGRKKVPKFVITRNAQVIRKSSDLVFVQEVKDCVEYKVEWQQQAAQLTLFDHEGE